jgi:hypothetical protein
VHGPFDRLSDDVQAPGTFGSRSPWRWESTRRSRADRRKPEAVIGPKIGRSPAAKLRAVKL